LLSRIDRQNPIAFDLDFALAAEQLKQNRDPLPGWNNSGDEDPQATERAAGDHHFRAGLRIGGDFDGFVILDERAQIGHHRVVDRRHPLAEMDDAANPRERIDLAATLEIFKAGKEVAGKERFSRPEGLAGAHPTETDARGEDLETQLALQDERDLVFLFRGGVEAIPVQGKMLKC